eukprot:Skav234858  [mRNA]  locus=scaffold840:102786:111941:- [translate_table: standard]
MQDYKPMHYDRGSDENGVPQLTVGASFGATRELTLMHVKSGVTMSFPQRNGDVFAFTPELNEVFMHGVPHVMPNSPAKHEPEAADGYRWPRGEACSGCAWSEDAGRLSLIIWAAKVSAHERPERNQCAARHQDSAGDMCRQGMGNSANAFFSQNNAFRQRGIMSEVVKPHRRQEVDSCKLGPTDLGTCCSTLRRSARAPGFSLSERLRAKAQEARRVTVERRRKWFEALDVRGAQRVQPLQGGRWNVWVADFWPQLDDFNNTEFDIRTPEQWLESRGRRGRRGPWCWFLWQVLGAWHAEMGG